MIFSKYKQFKVRALRKMFHVEHFSKNYDVSIRYKDGKVTLKIQQCAERAKLLGIEVKKSQNVPRGTFFEEQLLLN